MTVMCQEEAESRRSSQILFGLKWHRGEGLIKYAHGPQSCCVEKSGGNGTLRNQPEPFSLRRKKNKINHIPGSASPAVPEKSVSQLSAILASVSLPSGPRFGDRTPEAAAH